MATIFDLRGFVETSSDASSLMFTDGNNTISIPGIYVGGYYNYKASYVAEMFAIEVSHINAMKKLDSSRASILERFRKERERRGL